MVVQERADGLPSAQESVSTSSTAPRLQHRREPQHHEHHQQEPHESSHLRILLLKIEPNTGPRYGGVTPHWVKKSNASASVTACACLYIAAWMS